MESHIYDLQIRVLICKEDGEYVARALELDLLGYGSTENEAINELKASVEAQITFAHQMGDAGLLAFEADREYFKRWEESHRKALRSQIVGDKSMKLTAKATIIPISLNKLKTLRSRSFKQTETPVCA